MNTGQWLLALEEAPPSVTACNTLVCQCRSTRLPQPVHRYHGRKVVILKPIRDNWGPRVGIAWQVNPRRPCGRLQPPLDACRPEASTRNTSMRPGMAQVSGFDTGGINQTYTTTTFKMVESLASLELPSRGTTLFRRQPISTTRIAKTLILTSGMWRSNGK